MMSIRDPAPTRPPYPAAPCARPGRSATTPPVEAVSPVPDPIGSTRHGSGEELRTDTPSRYAVTLPGVPGRHSPLEVVVVHATDEVTADGTPVYADKAGTLRVEIIGETARPLAEPTGQGRHTCLHATPLP
ncbi:DUF6296 family protein [Streptomyces kaniharaensis]|uniref:DUF6296 family protein n=1 Tax=Streptomyces kaniharaensis TaxID=212423 RepID=UPI002DDDA0D4|nr:DUF6296 family protein [Streptomyces kaniharaensis]